MLGSVTSCFEVVFPPLPPLSHEAREITAATRINLAARSIRFRICNNSRTNLRCKLWKIRSQKAVEIFTLKGDRNSAQGVNPGLNPSQALALLNPPIFDLTSS
jgi:hypothetical protein